MSGIPQLSHQELQELSYTANYFLPTNWFTHMILYGKNGKDYENNMINKARKLFVNLRWILNHRQVQNNMLRTIFRYFWFHVTLEKMGYLLTKSSIKN